MEWIRWMRPIFENNCHISAYFINQLLTTHERWLSILLECPEDAPRSAFAEMIMAALRPLLPHDRPRYRGLSQTSIGSNGTLTCQLLDKLCLLILGARQHWRNFKQYFYLLCRFAECGPDERQLMLDRHMVAECVCFQQEQRSPHLSGFVNQSEQLATEAMGTKHTSADFSQLVRLIRILVCSCVPPSMIDTPNIHNEDQRPPTQTLNQTLDLPDLDLQYAKSTEFLKAIMLTKNNAHELSKVLCHFSWKDLSFSNAVIDLVSSGLNEYDETRYATFLHVLRTLLDMDDRKDEPPRNPTDRSRPYTNNPQSASCLRFQYQRVVKAMPSLLGSIRENDKYTNELHALCRFLYEVMQSNKAVGTWMNRNLDRWVWLRELISQQPSLIQKKRVSY